MNDHSNDWLDVPALQRGLERAATDADDAHVLDREVSTRLLERLQLIRIEPRRILDLGSGLGESSRQLKQRYRGSDVIALDRVPAMLRRGRRRAGWFRRHPAVCADAAALPLADASMDLVFSGLMLQWCPAPDRVFAECRRVLRPGGLLLFATLGPDTLIELRRAWAGIDSMPHVLPFPDMHDLGDMLVQCRFADPVMDVERLTLTYRELGDLYRDLRSGGALNVHAARRRGLTTPGRLRAMEAAYRRLQAEDGRLPATVEIVHGHAWSGSEPVQRKDETGAVAVSLESIKARLRRPAR